MNPKRRAMKKIMMALALLFSLSAVSFAQTKPEKKKAEKQATARKSAPTASKAESTAPVAPEATAATSKKAAGPMKKDGTPDKRFKANKDSSTVVHRKKDGTPDKRYKENKKS